MSATRMLTCLDYVSFAAPKLKKDALDFFHDAMKDGSKILVVGSNASYSGYLLNGRCYPGTHMKQGIETWCDKEHGGVAPYNAPVLLFHDAKLPAIGRVVKASYQRLWAGDDWFDDWRRPARGFDKGSGFTRLSMAITDADAQEKFLDGRYKTFSTSFRSPHILCSVCGTNLADGDCEHQIGQVYDKDGEERECYLVTGMQFNKEVSVVNHPAQPWAVGDEVRFVESVKEALSDSHVDQEILDSKFALGVGLTEVGRGLMLAVADAAGNATLLTVKDGEPDTIPARGKGNVELPKKFVVPDLEGSTNQDVDETTRELDDDDWALAHIASGLLKRDLLIPDRELKDVCLVNGGSSIYISGMTADQDGHVHTVSLQIDVASKRLTGYTTGTYPTDRKSTDVEYHEHSIDFEIDDLNADGWDLETRDASRGPSHMHALEVVMARDAEIIPTYEQCVDLANQFDITALQDATLSEARRKKLKSSTFCGPGRTFPVPDCAHVTAARRLIGRYKGSAEEKKRILSCVNARAEKLSCDAANDTGLNNYGERHPMTQPTTTPSPSGGKPGTAPAGTPDPKLEDSAKTVSLLTDQVKEEKDRVKTIQSELDSTKAERDAVQKKLTDAETNLHKERCERLALLRALTGEKPSGFDLETAKGLKDYATELMKRTPDSINDAIADAFDPVVSKLPRFKGLGGFIEDGTPPARDGAGQDLKHPANDAGKKSDKKPVTGKDLV